MKLHLSTAVWNYANAGLAFLYPEICQLCGVERATSAQGYVCENCWQDIRFVTEPFCERCGLPFEGDITTKFECANCREMELHFVSARAAVYARGPALEVIHRFKYSQSSWFEPFLADLLRRVAEPMFLACRCDLLVPVPLHPLKERERGFNQAALLSHGLGAALGIASESRLLQRRKPTETQTTLSRSERAQNVHDAFVTQTGCKLHGERVTVIDDVLTTGATTSACARALLQAGAGEVRVLTVARAVGEVH